MFLSFYKANCVRSKNRPVAEILSARASGIDIGRAICPRLTSDAITKGLFWHYILRKKPYLVFFFKFSTKRVPCAMGHIFNKVNSGT